MVNPLAALDAVVRFALIGAPARLRRLLRRPGDSPTVDVGREAWLERVFAEFRNGPVVQTERDFIDGVRQRIERYQPRGPAKQSGREPDLPD